MVNRTMRGTHGRVARRPSGLRKRLVLVPLVMLVGCGASLGSGNLDWRAQGSEAFLEGRLQTASEIFFTALKADPSDADASRWLAKVYRRQGRFQDALDLMAALESRKAMVPEDFLLSAHLCYGLGRHTAALKYYELAELKGALDDVGRTRRVMSAVYSQQASRALAWVKSDSTRLAENSQFQLATARTYVALSRPDDAILAYRKSAKLDRVNPIPESEAGAVLEAVGFRDRAQRAYERALKRNKEHLPSLLRLSKLLMSSGKALDAIPLLERAKRLSPDNVTVLSHLGAAFSALGMFEDATRALQKAIALEPGRAVLHSSLGETAYRAGHLELAEKHLRVSLGVDATRAADANALRQVVLMRELVALRCKGVNATEQVRQALEQRWSAEGWETKNLSRSMARVMNDSDALLMVDQALRKCTERDRPQAKEGTPPKS